MSKQTDEIAALRKRIEELEAKAKPPEPFKPEPYQRYDPTAGMSMPPSALAAMLAAEPRGFMSGVVHDNRAPTTPATIPERSTQVSGDRAPANVPGSGTGWGAATPLGPPPGIHWVDAQLIADDVKQRSKSKL
jgi:hypothetical protein